LKSGISRQDFERSIHDQRAEELLNWVEVQVGDMIYVDAGTVHTLGPGAIILETQQNSDVTFRLYDYGRPRELHIRQGLDAMKEKTAAGKIPRNPNGEGERLISAPNFVVDKVSLERDRDFLSEIGRSAEVLVALKGCGVVETPDAGAVVLAAGDAVIIPAAIGTFRVRPQWQVELLRAKLP
jgi:mannose-6-phosphate isomerase